MSKHGNMVSDDVNQSEASDTPARNAVRAIVRGVVQGVGFRHYTRLWAERTGVVGWVRNRWDGAVEIVAEGAPQRLQTFLNGVRRGPTHGRVDSVDLTWSEATGNYHGFRVRY
jgi:acylphosphatase